MSTFVLHNPTKKSPADSYRFRGASSSCAWPKAQGHSLSAAGAWNFLWRLGFAPKAVTVSELPRATATDVVFAHAEDVANAAALAGPLRAWLAAGGRVVASGHPDVFSAAGLQVRGSITKFENPYCGLAVDLGDIHKDGRPSLLAPGGWGYASVEPNASLSTLGALVAVGGERQSPSRALLTKISGAPAVITSADRRFCFLNGSPFSGFQAWLQGQEDLRPWLGWRHRLLWLDEWVSDVATFLERAGALALDQPRPGISGLSATTVVLRHDVDFSKDDAYLALEEKRGVAGTHAILDDENRAFWVKRLKEAKSQESAFHYSTGGRDWIGTAAAYLHGQRSGKMKAAPGTVIRDGLLKQVRRARKLGIGIRTLHRHLSFQQYPEWIDALDHVFQEEAEVLGGSSMFRGQVLRWGGNAGDGVSLSIGEWPDAQFPLWLPFKLAHAADGGRLLRGWESTSLMESEPGLVDQLLSATVKHLPQRVLTLGFHPAHARLATFAAGGSIGSFTEILDIIKTRHADVRSLADVYARATGAAS